MRIYSAFDGGSCLPRMANTRNVPRMERFWRVRDPTERISLMNQELTLKSRMDVVDTLVEYQQEVRVLRFLLLLFYLTAGYELLYVPLSEADDGGAEVAMTVSSNRGTRKTIPPGRLKNVQKALDNIMQKAPVFRQAFSAEIAGLSAIAVRLEEKSDVKTLLEGVSATDGTRLVGATARQDLVQQVKRLWTFCYHPAWADPGLFKELQQNLKALMGPLEMNPDEVLVLPRLDFGPRRQANATTAKRDIFHLEPVRK